MKKTFVSPLWIMAIISGLFMVPVGIAMVILGIVVTIHFYEEDPSSFIFLFFTVGGLGAIIGYILLTFPVMSSYLTVSPQKIFWKCPFRKSVSLNIEDCKFVGIDDMADNTILMPTRGDEISFIYLSTKPFPDKYHHKANLVLEKRPKDLIVFHYSDALCEKLMEVLPKEEAKEIASFYARMKAHDRLNHNKK